jgi:hypothetical protein
MIIHDLDVIRFVIDPFKAGTPLIVDTNTILSRPIALQLLKMVAWGREQVLKIFGIIQVDQLTAGGALNIFWQFRRDVAQEDFPGFIGSERCNHESIISRGDNIFKASYFTEKQPPTGSGGCPMPVQTLLIRGSRDLEPGRANHFNGIA